METGSGVFLSSARGENHGVFLSFILPHNTTQLIGSRRECWSSRCLTVGICDT